MLETPHVLVGAAIAVKIPNPLISIPLAFSSHFILEKVPHWNPHLNTEIKKYKKVAKASTNIVIADVLLSLGSGFFIATSAASDFSHAVWIILACFASVLPDVIEGPYFFLGLKSKFIKKWIDFQKSIQCDVSLIPGLLTQVITIATSIFWIYF